NPLSAARYRQRHSASGAKSDAGDAHVRIEVSPSAVGDPGLGAADAVALRRFLRATRQGRGVRAGLRLRQAVATDEAAAKHLGQPGASLEREITSLFTPAPDRPVPPRRDARASAALKELDEITRTATDPRFRAELTRIASELRATFMADHIDSPPLASGAAGCPKALAPREIEALQLVAIGLSNSEVASAMGLKTETVRAYLRSAMRRLDVHNRTAAVHVARQKGLLRATPPDW